ncbi:MAG TPA: orotidine-5'-phosphate decarboxylase [Candidatus Nanoarchaeia archaeon]|nr:orotidine-5'-phosphate decarboxylase [Candidatus Nanoarchaeia archaeon]
MVNFADRLLEKIDEKQNPICIGLDPRLDLIPKHICDSSGTEFDGAGNAIFRFNRALIDQLFDIVPAVKPQMAFYEQFGSKGVRAFEQTVEYAREKGLIVIEDGKRNDIKETAVAYAKGHLGKVEIISAAPSELFVSAPSFGVDALTINAYLGSDGVTPFVKECKDHDKGIFVLVKTSNPSSNEFQDLVLQTGELVYEAMAKHTAEWGQDLRGKRGYSSIGAVVGATYPAEAEKIRALLPHAIFLVPGYGAQGGGAKDVVPCFNADGYGAIVNNSRGVIFAYEKGRHACDPTQFAQAARNAALEMKVNIISALHDAGKLPRSWQR